MRFQKSKRVLHMPVKVCLYIPSFGPGGAERQIVSLARELAGRGVAVALLHGQKDLRHAYYLDAIRGTDVEVINVLSPLFLKEGIQLSKRHSRFFKHIPAPSPLRMGILFLAGAFSSLRPDIIHSYLDEANCTAGCAAVMAGVPAHLASFRSMDPQTAQYGWEALTFSLYGYLLTHARPHFEANSRAGVRQYASWLNIAPERIAYCPNGIDPDVYLSPSANASPELRHALHIPQTSPILLTLGKFTPEKAPEVMLDIFAHVHAVLPESHYIIAGSRMTEDDEMGEMVRERGLVEHVHLLGVQSNVAALLAGADVFLLPSRVEGFPNALMEAMAAKLPVVATNVGGVPDLVRHGVDGFLHEAGDVDGMAESVKALLGDAGLRARLGDAARQRILAEFSLRKLGDRVLQHYQRLLAEAFGRMPQSPTAQNER